MFSETKTNEPDPIPEIVIPNGPMGQQPAFNLPAPVIMTDAAFAAIYANLEAQFILLQADDLPPDYRERETARIHAAVGALSASRNTHPFSDLYELTHLANLMR